MEAGAASEGVPAYFSTAQDGAAGTSVMQRNAAVQAVLRILRCIVGPPWPGLSPASTEKSIGCARVRKGRIYARLDIFGETGWAEISGTVQSFQAARVLTRSWRGANFSVARRGVQESRAYAGHDAQKFSGRRSGRGGRDRRRRVR